MMPTDALDCTLFELSCWQRGRAEAARQQLQLAWWTAWQTANLSRARHLPPLKRGMDEIARSGRPPADLRQSMRAALAAMRADASARGLPPPKKRGD